MTSPHKIPFQSFISINKKDETPIYLQLVFGFIKAIQLKNLPNATKLPGSRTLSKILAVNRNTLIKALYDLEAQGFVDILPNKGVYIRADQNVTKQKLNFHSAEKPTFKFSKSGVLDTPFEETAVVLKLDDGLTQSNLHHSAALGSLYSSELKKKRRIEDIAIYQQDSSQRLNQHVLSFINLSRSLRLEANQFLTTSHHNLSLYLIIKVLLSQGDAAAVISPGYYRANMVLADRGVQVHTLPAGSNGIDLKKLATLCEDQKIKLLYLTSGGNYPTNLKIEPETRVRLLDLAHQYGFVIVEEDLDFDLQYSISPTVPLAAFNTNANIIYLSRLSNFLPSAFNFGFITGPAEFISELKKHKSLLIPEIDCMKERVVTQWLENGEVHRSAKKGKQVYLKKRDLLVQLVNKYLGSKVEFIIPERGLGLWLEWQEEFNLMQLKAQCLKKGLFIPKLILYQNRNLCAMRIGFGSLTEEEMEKAFDIISCVYEELISNKYYF